MDSIQKNVGVDRDEESNRIRNMSLNDPPHDDEKNNSFDKKLLEQKPVPAGGDLLFQDFSNGVHQILIVHAGIRVFFYQVEISNKLLLVCTGCIALR
nr:hypothetical protein [Tanacetum cinerariifolium]